MDKLFSLWFFFAVYTGARQHVQGNMSPATFPRILTISMLQNFVIFFLKMGYQKDGDCSSIMNTQNLEFESNTNVSEIGIVTVKGECCETLFPGHFACMMEGRRHWHRSVTWHPQFFVLLHLFSDVLVQTRVSVLPLNTDKQVENTSFFKPACLYLEIRGWTLSSVWTCFSNSSIFWEKIEIKLLAKFGCNLPLVSKYWLNINFFWIFFVNDQSLIWEGHIQNYLYRTRGVCCI